MVVKLPPELARLDADMCEAVIALAVELVTAPQPIEGLTLQQTRLIRILQSRPQHWFPAAALSAAIQCRDSDDPVSPHLASVVCWQVERRRPDLRQRVEARRDLGYRWTA